MNPRFPLLLTFFALPLTVLLADTPAEEWIAKGRAALGSETSLNAVKSVHFNGVLDTIQPKRDKAGAVLKDSEGRIQNEPLHVSIEIIFQKPFRQRITLISEKLSETTGLDDYDGWRRRAEIVGEGKWEMSLLDTPQIKQLRANVWENLFFYRGIERIGGEATFLGTVEVEGKASAKVAFSHGDGIVFNRFFERATGRLLKTETDAGGTIIEEGEIITNGVRFPQKLISKDRSGIQSTITFSSVKVNEVFPTSEFAVPTLGK